MFTEQFLYTLGSVILVSVISLIGIITIFTKRDVNKLLLYFVSFSAGALFGDVFLHLMPEIIEIGFAVETSFYILSGIVIFFILEKIINWHHCHHHNDDHCHYKDKKKKDHVHTFAYTNLIGDGLHNFVDGAVIAASYLVSVPLGITTTLAVIFHEIPQEIGDFGIMLYAKFSVKKALAFNFLSALTAVLGALFAIYFSKFVNLEFMIPFTVGAFIYIAGADLIPELHKEMSAYKGFLQLVMFILGIAVMWLLLLIE